MGSSRLPNKMLLHLHGFPICEWVYKRVLDSKKVDKIIFAIPDIKKDDVLAHYLKSINVRVFRGNENDLVERFHQAASHEGADIIIRICADNPLICGSEIDRLIDFFKVESCDYAYNHIPRKNKYPDGLGAEICSMQLLDKINENAVTSDHREHLFNYIWGNQDNFSIKTFEPPDEIAYPDLKLDIDTIEDYQRLLEEPYDITMNASEIVLLANKRKANTKNENS